VHGKKNSASRLNWDYESGLKGSGLGTWIKFCKFVVGNSLLEVPRSQEVQQVKVAKTSATLGKGVTVLRAKFKLKGGDVVAAIACSPWLTLDMELSLGKKAGTAKAAGKFLQISQLQVDGASVFGYHRARQAARAEVGIPVQYEPRRNRTHFKGEPKLRTGELIVDLKKVNGTWVVWKKLSLMAIRNPVDDGPESEKHLVNEEVDFAQEGKVHFARGWKPKSCSHALDAPDSDEAPGDADFQSSPLAVDWNKKSISRIKAIPESMPDITVAYKTEEGKVEEVAVNKAVA